MTRSYFVDYVTGWYELLDLCSDEGCNVCEDIIDDDQLDEWVESDIQNGSYNWRELRDFLYDIPTGYDYYRCDGSFDYVGMDDDDFEDYKERVLDWMDENGEWDDEEDEEEEKSFYPELEPEEEPAAQEDFSVTELIGMCGAELVTICQAAGYQHI